MQTAAVETFATILPALATIQANSARTTRNGKNIRIRRFTALTPELQNAVKVLVEAGHTVRVMQGNVISTPVIVDGALVWEERKSRKERPFLVFEIAL